MGNNRRRRKPKTNSGLVKPNEHLTARRDTEHREFTTDVLRDDIDVDSMSSGNPPVQLLATLSRMSVAFRGPLPPPNVLAEYGGIQPDLVDRIVSMAEKEQTHRHKREDDFSRASITNSHLGILSGFLIGVLGLGCATWLIVSGHDWAGSVLGGVDLIALVGIFVYGKHRNSEEKKEATSSKDLSLKDGEDGVGNTPPDFNEN